jgi:hypothetical protein
MPSCSISFSIFSCEINVACHSQEDNGPKCFAKSCIYNNGLYQFWSLMFYGGGDTFALIINFVNET